MTDPQNPKTPHEEILIKGIVGIDLRDLINFIVNQVL
jgi:hypothetical protein